MDIVKLMCSCCGKTEVVYYTVTDVLKTVKSGWDSFGDALYCPECVKTWNERNGTEKKLYGESHTIKKIDSMHECEVHTVVEPCSVCGAEIEMKWDVEIDGYKAFCPACGSRLMLCDECMHRDGECCCDCDYDNETDSCRFNQVGD